MHTNPCYMTTRNQERHQHNTASYFKMTRDLKLNNSILKIQMMPTAYTMSKMLQSYRKRMEPLSPMSEVNAPSSKLITDKHISNDYSRTTTEQQNLNQKPPLSCGMTGYDTIFSYNMLLYEYYNNNDYKKYNNVN